MDVEMASWKSTGTYVDEVPPPGANIVDGMWIFRHEYELHSLDFSTAFLQGSLHEEIWLRCPLGFTGFFPAGTQWSLRRPVYGLRQAPHEWHDTLRTTIAALGFAPSTADLPLFLRTNISLPPFYVLVYVLQRFGFQFSSPQPTPLSTGHSLTQRLSQGYTFTLDSGSVSCARLRFSAPVVRLRSTQGPWLHKSYAGSPTC
ncbi:unnamed protein product [Closterium sp. NIES-53]